MLADSKVLVSGGALSNTYLSSTELYDSSTGSWTATGAMQTGRLEHTVTLLSDGNVLAAGGTISGSGFGFNTTTSSCEKYNRATGTWSATGAMTVNRSRHRAVILADGRVMVMGGVQANGSPPVPLASCEIYDRAAGTWSAAATMPGGGLWHTATTLKDGKVLVTGGCPQYTFAAFNTCLLYDPPTNSWASTASMGTARYKHSATLLSDGRVLVAGGTNEPGFSGLPTTDSAEIYDPVAGTWSAVSGMAASRMDHSAILLNNGKVLVAGGLTGGFAKNAVSSSEIFDPATGLWSGGPSMAAVRSSFVASMLPNGKILVAGGSQSDLSTSGTIVSGAELLDPGLGFDSAWRPQVTAASINGGRVLSITGSGLRGISGASSGGTQDSATDFPLVQLRSLGNAEVMWAAPTASSATSFTSAALGSFAPGHLLMTVFTNGIPSESKVLLNPLGPEIAIEQPVSTNISDGSSSDFGSTLVTGSSSLTFTLKNTGNAALTGLSLTQDGANAADFTVSAIPTPLAAQSSTTFTVTFAPTAIGARTAVIHIASDDEDENPFDLTLTGSGISPEIAVEYPTNTQLTDGVSFVNLPTTSVGSSSAAQTFTVRNTGTAPLTGISITKDGANSAEFAFSTPVTSLAVGAAATFTVTFSPTGSGGPRSAAIHIASSDLDENPFDIALTATANAAEIEVEQPAGSGLVDGVSTVDYGPVLVGSNLIRTFTIRNSGALTLSGLSLSKAGTDSANFTLGSLSVSNLAAGATTTFTVTFAPGAAVTRNATVRVACNDFDENPFDIAVTGVGIVPEIAIEQPVGTDLADGSASVAFMGTNVGASTTQTFTVRNVGGVVLTGLALSKAGTNTADFTLGTLSVTTLNPGESTTFDLTFFPQAYGNRSAILRVASSDADENPFDINLGGTGLATEIVVEQPVGTNVSDGGNKSFGSVLLGSSASLTFTIKNIGNLDLTGLSITKDGANADEFTITAAPTAPVAGPAGSTTFTVQFTPTALGSRSAAIHIASNDADENPFDIQLTGTGTSPEIVVEHPTSIGLQDGVSVLTLPATDVGSEGNIMVTLRNTGTATLTSISITKDGDHSGDFGVSTPAAVLNAGSSTTFTVSFTPSALGTRTAAIHIASSDLDENPFDIQLTATATSPEVEVEQPVGMGLADGVSTVDYGPVSVSSSLIKTYTVRNTGTSSLTSLSLSKAGTNSTLFTVSSLGSTTLAVGASTTFTVSYAPNAVGSHSAIIRLASSDLDENPFGIGVTGSGTAPEIAIEQPVGTNLTDNVSSISFPATAAGSSSDPVTFTVRNTGSATLSGLALSKAGTNTADFVLGTLGATSLAPTESTTFTVIFSPTAGGTHTATLRVASDDADENPFDIALSGSATAPTISIEQPVNFALTSGSSVIDFGELPPGTPIGRTFRIRNTGTAPLSNILLTKSGANPGDFTVGTPGVTTIAPGTFTTVSVIFNPVDGGYRNATLNIASNATNVSNFVIQLTGAGLGPEIKVATPSIFLVTIGYELFNGTSTLDFGTLATGAPGSTTQSLVISNIGLLDLSSLAVQITGAAASDFSVSALSTSSLAPGANTTISLSFTPSATGVRTATLQIGNSDSNESPFTVTLTGNGRSRLESWRMQNFGFEFQGYIYYFGSHLDEDDPDGDGIPNLLEFATGQHPQQNSTLTQSLKQGTGGQLIYTYQRAKDAVIDGLIFAVQHNATLDSAGWSSTGITETILSDNGTIQVIEAIIPAPTGSACFTRLRVQRP
jgi:N-acetylneuraminic acid mutarotase/uncharacterized membrane protein